MQESLAGDWNDLTEEERYELELEFQGNEWADDYPDENSPEEQAFREYKIEEERLICEAVAFYKKYLTWETQPSVVLRRIFCNNDKLLHFFLSRVREGMKEGAEIALEVKAILEVQKGSAKHLINKDKTGEPLRRELERLGFRTKKKANWYCGFDCGKIKAKKLADISLEYERFLGCNSQ
jgi:hypothetical protein